MALPDTYIIFPGEHGPTKIRAIDSGDNLTYSLAIAAEGGSQTIAGPLDRRADAQGVSVALSTEDVALLNLLLTTSAFQARTPALGPALAAASTPVTLANDGVFATSFGLPADTEATTDTGSFSFISFVKRLLNTKLKIGQQTKAASLAVVPASDWGAFDSTDRFRTSLYGKVTTAGDTAVLLDSSGREIAVGAAAIGAAPAGNPILIAGWDGTNVAYIRTTLNNALQGTLYNTSGTAIDAFAPVDTATATATLKVNSVGATFNGTNWDRLRGMTANTVLVSAARTATVSTDVTNYNGRSFAVILNITAAPNTASTITIQIRVKDSISGNYVTLLASAAILGTATTGIVPNTTRYVVALGETVAANLAASDALGRTMNVNVVHSNADSWTYSVSVDIGV